MNTRIKSKKEVPVTQEVKRYLDAKLASLGRLLGKTAEKARCEVELGKAAGKKHQSDYMWYAEVHIKVPGEIEAYAKNHAQTVNAAIDDVKEEVERQLRKGKKKQIADMRRAGAKIKRMVRE